MTQSKRNSKLFLHFDLTSMIMILDPFDYFIIPLKEPYTGNLSSNVPTALKGHTFNIVAKKEIYTVYASVSSIYYATQHFRRRRIKRYRKSTENGII